MTTIINELRRLKNDARHERFETTPTIPATTVQDAIELVASQPVAVSPTVVNASPYAVQDEDSYLLVKVVPAIINLPTVASRGGRPLTIKDGTSTAGQPGNNITINAAGGDTIDTLASIVINQDSGSFSLVPPPGQTDWNIT